jgi:hypothetical protein
MKNEMSYNTYLRAHEPKIRQQNVKLFLRRP